MELPTGTHEVIEITDDSNDDDDDYRLEDFMTADELNTVLRGPFGRTPDTPRREPHPSSSPPLTDRTGTPIEMSYESCLKEVLEVFPDVSHDHVKKLYDESHHIEAVARGLSLAEHLISKILDEKRYPKERDRLNELKRKRMSELDREGERAAEWENAERVIGDSTYLTQARTLLQEDFSEIPVRYIDLKLKELGRFYATYLALDIAEETYGTSAPRPYVKLRKTRKPSHISSVAGDEMGPLSAFQKLKDELGAARTQRKKLQTERQIKKAAIDAEAAEDEALRASGQVMECACCFTDDITINKITWCSADVPHAFCLDCAATNANTQIGLVRYKLECMDSSGCKGIFSREERKRFLDDKTIEKLERIQQQTELREANLDNLETCPFCEFAAICDPIEVDKEFRCGNSECEKVSCRKCRNVTHIPMSCAEFKKENGVSERHQLEEARTNALLRRCPKCKSAIIKDGGCNKIMCSCGGAVCDYCGKDITKDKYSHFRDGPLSTGMPGLRGKCPTYDDERQRNQQNVEKAEKEAMAKVRKENPDLSEEDLRIKFRENVKTPPRGVRGGLPAYHPHYHGPQVFHPNDPNPNNNNNNNNNNNDGAGMFGHRGPPPQGYQIPPFPPYLAARLPARLPQQGYPLYIPPLQALGLDNQPFDPNMMAPGLPQRPNPPQIPTGLYIPRFGVAVGQGAREAGPRRRFGDDEEDEGADGDGERENWEYHRRRRR
ncbi:MAG: hypothetical protein L6R39_006338 [Caloplaca ligustica]|nr:MAG: hypothetical protein L6R39_006338 [Caloplaca ligustica]